MNGGRLVLMLGLLAVMSGCAGVKPDAFGRSKTYAIVSIVATPKIESTGDPRNKTITGMVKAAASKESGYSHDADRIFRETLPIFKKAFAGSKNFRLLPEGKVINSGAYSRAAGDKPSMFMTTFKVAPGYKFFSDEKKCASLAKALNVDGVICIMVNYGFAYNGVNVAGIVGGGAHKGIVNLTVAAYDRNGNVVWNDNVRGKSDDSIGGASEAVNFTELHPLLLDASGLAVKELLKNLAEKLG